MWDIAHKMAATRVFLLDCACMNYAWGKLGSESEVADLKKCGDPGFIVDESLKYAELWMGTHDKGPSRISGTDLSLKDYIRGDPNGILGARISERFGAELPYLLKVLSVGKSLSIQAHPCKSLAEELHRRDPKNYPDSNHKPEMAIALTPFEGLCGFRPALEIAQHLNDVPELSEVVGKQNAKEFASAVEVHAGIAMEFASAVEVHAGIGEALKKCFTCLMNCDREFLKQKSLELQTRLIQQKVADEVSKLYLRLYNQFPGDIGCFVSFFLNHILLQPGEAMFLGPNVPHAYLFGDAIECMACSDNTIRAGLTPKFIDTDTLCGMLEYKCSSAEENKFQCVKHASDGVVSVYDPPVPDFCVAKIDVPVGMVEYTLEQLDTASIVLTILGNAQIIKDSSDGEILNITRGSVIFVSAGEPVTFKIQHGGMLMFRAYSNM